MVRIALLVASVAALVGCGSLSNTVESPALKGRVTKAAVVTTECDGGTPAASLSTKSGEKMRAVLKDRHMDVAAPSDPSAVCAAYGKGMGAVDGFTVPASVIAMIRDTAKASGSETVLVNVVSYNRGCSDHEPKCDKSIDGATVRDFLFSADGTLLWKKWDFAPENGDEAEHAIAMMLADVPADKLITASNVAPKIALATTIVAAAVPAPTPAPALAPAPAAETPASLLKEITSDTNAACVAYAKLTCEKTNLDACRDAVDFVNGHPSAANCKTLSKRIKARKVATR